MIELENYATHLACFFINDNVIVKTSNNGVFIPLLDTVKSLDLTVDSAFLDGNIVNVRCRSNKVKTSFQKKGFDIYTVKSFLAALDQNSQIQLMRAYHWANWDIHSQFCGKCSSPLTSQWSIAEKKCISCNISIFPKVSCAVMVLIYRENQILLARSPHFKNRMYSAIAGFIEMGETAEAAVHREVKEELGIEVCDLEYFATQSWPFPDSFMIAFKAKYLKGDVVIDNIELDDAQWFNIDNLPELPSPVSISRQLIEKVILSIK